MVRKKEKFSKAMIKSSWRMREAGLVAQPTDRASLWIVPSETITGARYNVTVRDEDRVLVTSCSCKSGRFNRGCKHQLIVLHEFNRSTLPLIKLLVEQGIYSTEKAA